MKTLAVVLFLLATTTSAQISPAAFKYDKKRAVPVGTVLHYVKTNIDGTKPEYVSQYISNADTLESFKFHIKGDRAGLVIAEMDWKHFAAGKLTSWRVYEDDKRELFGTIEFDFSAKTGTTKIPSVSDKPDSFTLPLSPTHLYNFDLASLNFALPHLRNPKGEFVFGIADPTFGASDKLVEYKGEVTMKFLADETRNSVRTRKYSVNGKGLQNKGGYIWVNKEHGWMEDMEIELPDNPEWKSFKLKLLRRETMTKTAWDEFRNEQFGS